MHALVLAALLASAQPAAVEESRSLRLSVFDPRGQAVVDLEAREVVVVENGVARPVTRLSPDNRKIALALVVDTSTAVQDSYRLQMLPAIVSVLHRLPTGTRVTVWTSGARPARIAEATANTEEAIAALQRAVPDGGNTLFDTIDAAVADLTAAEAQRSVLLIVTSTGVEFSSGDRPRVAEDPRRLGATEVYAAAVEDGTPISEPVDAQEGRSPMERRANYDRALDSLTRETGGRLERAFSFMSLAPALDAIASDLSGGYRLSYSTAVAVGRREVEVRVARPKVRLRYAKTSQAD
jgi:VWFA-related protein